MSKLVHKINSLDNDDTTNFNTNKVILQKLNASPNLEMHHFETSEFTTNTCTGQKKHTVKALITSGTIPVTFKSPASPTSKSSSNSNVGNNNIKYVCVAFGGPESSHFWNMQKSSLMCPMGPSDQEGNSGLPFDIELPVETIEEAGVIVADSPVKKPQIGGTPQILVEEEKVKQAKEKIKGMSLLETIEAQRDDQDKTAEEDKMEEDTGIVAVVDDADDVEEVAEESTAAAVVDATEDTSILVEDTNNLKADSYTEEKKEIGDNDMNDEMRILGSPSKSFQSPESQEEVDPLPSTIEEEPQPPSALEIHAGINSALFDTGFHQIIEKDLNLVLATHPGHKIIITGFGMGGAIATVFASFLCKQKPISSISVLSFGSPRIASDMFGKWLENQVTNLLIWRFVLRHDYIAGLPSVAIGFRHFGHMMHLEDDKGKETKAYYYSGVKGIGEGVGSDGYFKPPELRKFEIPVIYSGNFFLVLTIRSFSPSLLVTPMMELVDPIDHHDMNSYIQFLQKKSVTNPKTYYANQFVRTEESSYKDSSFLERCLNMLDKTCGSA